MRGVDWTDQQLAEAFGPGREVMILLPRREAFRRAVLRQAIVLGRHQDDLALSPPEPSLPQPMLGQGLEVTTLVPDGGRHQRYAYRACVLDELVDFPAGSGGRAVVVTCPRQEDLYATSLRRAQRFRVASRAPVRLFWGDDELELLDISIKGLRCTLANGCGGLVVAEAIQLTLEIHDEPFKVGGRVAGINEQAGRCELSVELGILALDAWASLQELIAELEPLD